MINVQTNPVILLNGKFTLNEYPYEVKYYIPSDKIDYKTDYKYEVFYDVLEYEIVRDNEKIN